MKAGADPDSWSDEAFSWACAPIRGEIAPLIVVARTIGVVDGYEVSDILVDAATSDRSMFSEEELHWDTVVEYASQEAYGAIAIAARNRAQFEPAVDASDALSAAAQLGLERGQRRRLRDPAKHAEQKLVDEIDNRPAGGWLAGDAQRAQPRSGVFLAV